MADAVISVVAERVAALIEDQILRQLNLVRGVEEEVGRLSDKLKTIRCVLDDAENRGAREQSVKNWLKKLEDVAYEMDDILDEWNYALLNHKMEEADQSTDAAVASAKQKVCCSFIPSSSCLCFKKVAVRHKTGKKIQNVKAKIDMILKEKDDFKFEPSLPKDDPMPKPPRVQSTSSIEVEKIHGVDIEKNKNDIVKKLMMGNGDSEILSIVGMGGLGKTTLAQLVFNDTRVKGCFKLRIWICVSDPFDLGGIARAIVESVTKERIPRDRDTDQSELILEKLRDCISGKKFLLVLDDVWTEDYNKWEPLKINLKEGAAAGSKIMVTTRKESVAKMMMRGNVDVEIYRPEKLSEEECWMLLRSISLSGRSEEECGMFEDVGRKIASKCEGLPLAANVLGSLLQFKENLEDWEDVLKSEIWQLEKAQVELFPHLLLSYNELSPTLKRCFSYCAVYPKDSKIKVENLIEEWMALGYLGSVTGNGGVEPKGRDYLNNLAMRSLFQEVKKSYGSIVLCKMHDIVHDFALLLRGNNDILHEGGVDVTKSGCQDCSSLLVSWVQKYRSSVWGKDSPMNVCDCLTSVRVLRFEWCSRDGLPQGMKKLIHLRWLELSGNKLSEEDLKIICRLYFLQTLLLSSCSLKKIPIEIGNLVELRHLDLNCNNELKELPESMCSLVELRFLNLEFCSILRELPEGIHRLRNLQHLFIQETPASRCLPQELGELSGLRTLSGYCSGSGCSKLGLLKKLNDLRALIFEINFTNTSDLDELVKDAEEAELRSKEHIHRLEITFNKDEVEGSSSSLRMEVMEALEPYQQKLNELVIGGYRGSRLPQWISLPLSGVKIISLGSFDELSSLPPLGKLPFLEILTMGRMKKLKVVERELLGIESSPSTSSTTTTKEVVAFPKLKQLSIIYFPKWLEWEDITAEEEEESILISIMPRLEELHVEMCVGLKKLPHRLLRKASSTLRRLYLMGSSLLQSQYGDENGSEWRSISQNNPQLRLCSYK